jgi:hypothetical protein
VAATFKIDASIEQNNAAYFALCDMLRAITDPATDTGRYLASLSGTIYITRGLYTGTTLPNASWNSGDIA